MSIHYISVWVYSFFCFRVFIFIFNIWGANSKKNIATSGYYWKIVLINFQVRVQGMVLVTSERLCKG